MTLIAVGKSKHI